MDPKIKIVRAERMAWYRAYMIGKSCAVCGYDHPSGLDWHHKDPTIKKFQVTAGVRSGYAIKKILYEISKCVLVCSTCHRRHHWIEQFGPVQDGDGAFVGEFARATEGR